MLVTLDLDTSTLVYSPGNLSRLQTLLIPRGSGTVLRVQTVRSGLPAALPVGFGLVWTCRLTDERSGVPVAEAEGFSEEAVGMYSANVDYSGSALDAELRVGESGEKASLIILGQLAWRTASGQPWQPVQVINVDLHNSIWRGISGEPAIGSTAMILRRITEEVDLISGSPVTVFSFPVVSGAVYELELNLILDSSSDLQGVLAGMGAPVDAVVSGRWPSYVQGQPMEDQAAYDTGSVIFTDDESSGDPYHVPARFLIEMGGTPGNAEVFMLGTAASPAAHLRVGSWGKMIRLL